MKPQTQREFYLNRFISMKPHTLREFYLNRFISMKPQSEREVLNQSRQIFTKPDFNKELYSDTSKYLQSQI